MERVCRLGQPPSLAAQRRTRQALPSCKIGRKGWASPGDGSQIVSEKFSKKNRQAHGRLYKQNLWACPSNYCFRIVPDAPTA
jgi:hypothetical protein